MDFALDLPDSSARVDDSFVDDDDGWLIHAVVRYRPALSMETRKIAESEARIEVLRHMTQVARLARSDRTSA